MALFGPPDVESLEETRDVKGLCKALRHSDHLVRRRAAQALGNMGDPQGVEPLIAALKDDEKERFVIVSTLGQLGDARAVQPVIAVLRDQDEDQYVRSQAVEALGKIGDARAVEPLMEVLMDEDMHLRGVAARALAQLGDTRAVDALIVSLRSYERNDLDDGYGREEGRALGMLGDTSAVEPLIVLLREDGEEGRQLRMGSSSRALGAVEALGMLGDVRAFEPLVANLDLYGDAAVEALGKLGDIRAVDHLLPTLEDAELANRRAAAIALGELGDARAVEPLMAVVIGPNDHRHDPYHGSWEGWYERFRGDAARALGNLGDARAVAPLIPAVGDPDIAAGAVDGLEHLVERAATEIAADELQVMAQFRDVSQNVWEGGSHLSLSGTEPVDCSRLGHLAKEELERRGITI